MFTSIVTADAYFGLSLNIDRCIQQLDVQDKEDDEWFAQYQTARILVKRSWWKFEVDHDLSSSGTESMLRSFRQSKRNTLRAQLMHLSTVIKSGQVNSVTLDTKLSKVIFGN